MARSAPLAKSAPPRTIRWLERIKEELESDEEDSDSDAELWYRAKLLQRRLSLEAATSSTSKSPLSQSAATSVAENAVGSMVVSNNAFRLRRQKKLRAKRQAAAEAEKRRARRAIRFKRQQRAKASRERKKLRLRELPASTEGESAVVPSSPESVQPRSSDIHAAGSAMRQEDDTPASSSDSGAESAATEQQSQDERHFQQTHSRKRRWQAQREERRAKLRIVVDDDEEPSTTAWNVSRDWEAPMNEETFSPSDSDSEVIPPRYGYYMPSRRTEPVIASHQEVHENVGLAAVSSDSEAGEQQTWTPLYQLTTPASPIDPTETQLISLQVDNSKTLMQRTVIMKQLLPALHLQIQRQEEESPTGPDDGSDARMVLLLQEQVQRLQQREQELMRALVRTGLAPRSAAVPAPAALAVGTPEKQLQRDHHHGSGLRHQKQRRKGNNGKRRHPNATNGGNDGTPKLRRCNLKKPLTKDMPRQLAEMLNEPKQALLHRVVKHVGPKQAWQLLKETLRLEQEGGQQVNALASGKPERFFVVDEASNEMKPRRRTTGGVYFALLKEKVSKEMYRTIYEVEDKKKKDAKKRSRNRQRQRMDKTLSKLGFDGLTLATGGDTAAKVGEGIPSTEAAGLALGMPISTSTSAVPTAAEDGKVKEDMELL
ncbi:hypothetical protein BBJ28_00011802 [Nothophytophthora sp. Chile5]|nr:hypothetical protein BBJ28_00011802 [Nothophytophthora sp. Chile5]